ncbi:MAG: envelope stress response membrane protein PspC [Vibrio sp.]
MTNNFDPQTGRKQSLYRDTKQGKIAGVCAGLARYFGMEVWWVRIIAVSVMLLGGSILVILAYIGMWLMLEKRPAHLDEADFDFDHTMKSKPWQKGQTPSDLLAELDREYGVIERKLGDMEAYVTSDAHKVNREFSKL